MNREKAVQNFFQNMDGSTALGYRGSLQVQTQMTQKQGRPALHVVMKNIPFSGGSHMMPNGFKVLDVLNKYECHHEAHYVPTGEQYAGKANREKKNLELHIFFD